MENGAENICLPAVSVRISCDRISTRINVTGNICAQSAVEVLKQNFPSMDNNYFLHPQITAVPDGYLINVHGRKSVKNYLSENKFISCCDIFTVCEIVQKIFDTYGKETFSDVLFDYNAIFIGDEINSLCFVFVPFLSMDKRRIKCSEFLRVLYVHMSETDYESEKTVAKLISFVNEWENSDYGKVSYSQISKCIGDFRETFAKNKKQDILSRGSIVIRRFAENINCIFKDGHTTNYRITLSCNKSRYSYVYDDEKKHFFPLHRKQPDYGLASENISIGRDKAWANMRIEDMTVSGRFAKISFKDNKFFIDFCNISAYGNDELLPDGGAYTLKDGQELRIGKFVYSVKIQKHAV